MGTGMNYVKRPTILDALVRAGKLLSHTRDLIKNEKVFDPGHDFQKRLLTRIYDTALDVNSKAYVANELRVEVNPRIAAERLMLQAHAIASCECLLGLIADARVAFGLDTRKFWNWARMAKDTLTRLRAWHESDRRRYGELAAKIRRGEVSSCKLDASYDGVRACMMKGTNRRLVRRMDKFVASLKGEPENEW